MPGIKEALLRIKNNPDRKLTFFGKVVGTTIINVLVGLPSCTPNQEADNYLVEKQEEERSELVLHAVNSVDREATDLAGVLSQEIVLEPRITTTGAMWRIFPENFVTKTPNMLAITQDNEGEDTTSIIIRDTIEGKILEVKLGISEAEGVYLAINGFRYPAHLDRTGDHFIIGVEENSSGPNFVPVLIVDFFVGHSPSKILTQEDKVIGPDNVALLSPINSEQLEAYLTIIENLNDPIPSTDNEEALELVRKMISSKLGTSEGQDSKQVAPPTPEPTNTPVPTAEALNVETAMTGEVGAAELQIQEAVREENTSGYVDSGIPSEVNELFYTRRPEFTTKHGENRPLESNIFEVGSVPFQLFVTMANQPDNVNFRFLGDHDFGIKISNLSADFYDHIATIMSKINSNKKIYAINTTTGAHEIIPLGNVGITKVNFIHNFDATIIDPSGGIIPEKSGSSPVLTTLSPGNVQTIGESGPEAKSARTYASSQIHGAEYVTFIYNPTSGELTIINTQYSQHPNAQEIIILDRLADESAEALNKKNLKAALLIIHVNQLRNQIFPEVLERIHNGDAAVAAQPGVKLDGTIYRDFTEQDGVTPRDVNTSPFDIEVVTQLQSEQ